MLMKSLHFWTKLPLLAFLACWVYLSMHTGLFAQGQNFILVNEYFSFKNFVSEDILGNKYTIEKGQLNKITPNFKVISYSNPQYGSVSDVDVSDPLNILAFFSDFGSVAVLDANLSEKKFITAHELMDDDLPSQVCFSARQGFWAFFPNVFRLARYSFKPTREIVSDDLSLNHDLRGDVLFMQEENDHLFLFSNGIWVFDLYANFLFYIQHIHTPHLQIKESNIFYIKENQLFIYDFFLAEEDVFLLPQNKIKEFWVKNNQTIYLQTDVSLLEYKSSRKFY